MTAVYCLQSLGACILLFLNRNRTQIVKFNHLLGVSAQLSHDPRTARSCSRSLPSLHHPVPIVDRRAVSFCFDSIRSFTCRRSPIAGQFIFKVKAAGCWLVLQLLSLVLLLLLLELEVSPWLAFCAKEKTKQII